MVKKIFLCAVFYQLFLVTRAVGAGAESILAARSILDGQVPYRDFMMHIGPVGAFLLVGLMAVPVYAWYSLVYIGFNLLTAYGIYRLALARHEMPWAALLCAGVFLVIVPAFGGNEMYPEVLMTTFGIWALVFVMTGRPFLASVCFALSPLVKQTGAVFLLGTLPFLAKDLRLKIISWVGILASVFALGLYKMGALGSFLDEYVFWTTTHALIAIPHSRMDVFKLAPGLWFLFAVARSYPLEWFAIACLFLLEFMIVPIAHYMIPLVAVLALISGEVFVKAQMNRPGLVWNLGLALLAINLLPVSRDLFRPFRPAFGLRPYGFFDTAYYAEKVSQEPVVPPVWTNNYNLYVEAGLPLVTPEVFESKLAPKEKPIDWTRPPYDQIKTRVEFLPTNTQIGELPEEIPGWQTKVVPLERGQFHAMRVRTRA